MFRDMNKYDKWVYFMAAVVFVALFMGSCMGWGA
jgi:hypothetical protein